MQAQRREIVGLDARAVAQRLREALGRSVPLRYVQMRLFAL